VRVLVVEDEPILAELIARGLRAESLAVDTAGRGDEADELLSVNDYDVVVLDRDLPGLHGDAVARRVVERGGGPRILMLTASGTLGDRVAGLELGADDYLAKPFEFPELVARVRALGRRSAPALPATLAAHDLRLDVARHRATRAGLVLDLTPKEFMILETLLMARGGIVSSEVLLEKCWDRNTDPFTGAVRVALSKLRAKLGEPALIETVQGRGYRL
jgi:DNA-binding response OmpR family regulator